MQKISYDGNEVAILVCRAFAGRCQQAPNQPNTGSPVDNVADLTQNIEDETYMSTRGSEWPATGFRVHDFILPDDDQIMPEFIVYCDQEGGVLG